MPNPVGIIASAHAAVGPILFKTALGSGVDTLSGNLVGIFITNPIEVGDLVVVRVATDNLSDTTPTFTCTDTGGNTYVTHHQIARNAVAAAGCASALMATRATAPVATSGSIAIHLSGSVAAKAAYAESFTGAANTVRFAPIGVATGTGSVNPGSTSTVPIGDLVLGYAALETNAAPITGDADTTNGAWSTIFTLANAAGGTATDRVQVGGQWKITSGTAGFQNWSTGGPVTDTCGGVVVLIPG